MDAGQEQRERTSAIADGQTSDAEIQNWLSEWERNPELRDDWRMVHLIGDVLRSEELAGDVRRDERVLQGVRAALAEEPVVLSPRSLNPAPASDRVQALRQFPRRLMTGSAAAAAGVALVMTAYFGTRLEVDAPMGGIMAATSGGAAMLSGGFVPAAPAPTAEDLRRASTLERGQSGGSAAVGGFREILRLPRGPAANPYESMQVLYSDGSATISLQIEPFREGEHLPRAEVGERLNTLSLQRHGSWITLTGDVPLGTLQQFATLVPSTR